MIHRDSLTSGGQTLNYMRRVSLQKHHRREMKLKGLQDGKFLHDSLKNVDKRKKPAAISNTLKIKCVVAFSETFCATSNSFSEVSHRQLRSRKLQKMLENKELLQLSVDY